MARFVFRLERLLEHRTRLEREAQLRLGEVERERVAIENELRARQLGISAARVELRDALAPGGPMDVSGVRLQLTASLGLVGKANDAVLRLAGTHKRLETARGEYLEARASRRAVQILKEKALTKWRRQEEKREAAETDEIVTAREGRRRRRLEARSVLDG